jgi:hypothetical protein
MLRLQDVPGTLRGGFAHNIDLAQVIAPASKAPEKA